jgi:hypothetical protein
VVNQISALLSSVDVLAIIQDEERNVRRGHDIRWLEFFRPFTAVEVLFADDSLSWHLALKNVTEERAAEVLPALKLLRLEDEPASLEAFLAARQNVGRPVTVINEDIELEEIDDESSCPHTPCPFSDMLASALYDND